MLGGNPEAQRRVTQLIGELARDRGYRLYVVISRSLISSNANDLAARLQQEWLPEGRGLVVVYATDNRDLGFGRTLDPDEGMGPGKTGVPAYEQVRIIVKAMDEARQEQMQEAFVETLVTAICTEIEAYFARKEAPVSGDRSLRLALVTVGALSLLALCGMGLGWLMGKADRGQSNTRFFPEVDVPERLGAPYGGGCGGSGNFGAGGKEIG